jgi:hypothetical protein
MTPRAAARWVVRITPTADWTVDDLLKVPLSLDIWEREAGALVAAVPEQTIAELQRRRIAEVERLRAVSDLDGNESVSDGRPERRGES